MKKSSRAWIDRHISDPYVQKATKLGYRSRAAFKLMQIHEKDRLFQKGQTVLDLGASPGGWAQQLVKILGPKGTVVAVDLLPMEPIAGVTFIQGDFLADNTLEALKTVCPPKGVDWIISDMAPNLSGMAAIDQPRMMLLAETTLELAPLILKPKGGLLIKILQGEGIDDFRRALKEQFSTVQTRKPDASRAESSEIYLLARGFKVV